MTNPELLAEEMDPRPLPTYRSRLGCGPLAASMTLT